MYEVADSVEFLLPLDEACRRCAWARCFLLSPALVEKQGGRAKRELFTFLVAVSLLGKIKVCDPIQFWYTYFYYSHFPHDVKIQ